MDDEKPKDERPFHVRASEVLFKNAPPPSRNAPRLTHAGKCQVYVLLYHGQKPEHVARLFNITRSTVSYIGGCRDDTRKPVTFEMAPGHFETVGGPQLVSRNMNRKPRYQEVAAEFESLGEDEFLRRYLTPGLWDRLNEVKAKIRAEYRQMRIDKGLQT